MLAATLRSHTWGSPDESRCGAIHKLEDKVKVARLKKQKRAAAPKSKATDLRGQVPTCRRCHGNPRSELKLVTRFLRSVW
jgi:hypothetical protein